MRGKVTAMALTVFLVSLAVSGGNGSTWCVSADSSDESGTQNAEGAAAGTDASETDYEEEMSVVEEIPESEMIYPDESFMASGEYWKAVLGPGNYTIGVDIPLGVVSFYAVSGSGRITSSDGMLAFDMLADESEDPDFEFEDEVSSAEAAEEETSADADEDSTASQKTATPLDKDTYTYSEMDQIMAEAMITGTLSEYEAVGFDEGVVISVTGALEVQVIADNCDLSGMARRQKEGDPIELSPGEYEAGTDIGEGLYNITALDGIGSVTASDSSLSVYMACPEEPGINSEKFFNYQLTEGTVLKIDGVTVRLQKMSE